MWLAIKLRLTDGIHRTTVEDTAINSLYKLAECLKGMAQGIDVCEHFGVYYKDLDGDEIVISTEDDIEELIIFIRNQPAHKSILLYLGKKIAFSPSSLSVNSDSSETAPVQEAPLHIGIQCNGCDAQVRGNRYKCLVCADYDLCSVCENKHFHDKHPMVRISSPMDTTWRRAFSRSDERDTSAIKSQHTTIHGQGASPTTGCGAFLPPFQHILPFHQPPPAFHCYGPPTAPVNFQPPSSAYAFVQPTAFGFAQSPITYPPPPPQFDYLYQPPTFQIPSQIVPVQMDSSAMQQVDSTEVNGDKIQDETSTQQSAEAVVPSVLLETGAATESTVEVLDDSVATCGATATATAPTPNVSEVYADIELNLSRLQSRLAESIASAGSASSSSATSLTTTATPSAPPVSNLDTSNDLEQETGASLSDMDDLDENEILREKWTFVPSSQSNFGDTASAFGGESSRSTTAATEAVGSVEAEHLEIRELSDEIDDGGNASFDVDRTVLGAASVDEESWDDPNERDGIDEGYSAFYGHESAKHEDWDNFEGSRRGAGRGSRSRKTKDTPDYSSSAGRGGFGARRSRGAGGGFGFEPRTGSTSRGGFGGFRTAGTGFDTHKDREKMNSAFGHGKRIGGFGGDTYDNSGAGGFGGGFGFGGRNHGFGEGQAAGFGCGGGFANKGSSDASNKTGGFGQAKSSFGAASSGFGQAKRAFGDASSGFGQARNAFGAASSGFGQPRSDGFDWGQGFGRPRRWPDVESDPAAPASTEPAVRKTLRQLLDMGYGNEGGWLTALVESKHGDINAVLDAMRGGRKH